MANLLTDSGLVDNAMETEPSEPSLSITQRVASPTLQDNPINDNDRYDVVVVSSVGMHVEGPIPFINPAIPIEQHAIVQIESNDVDSNHGEVEYDVSTVSVASSRNESPIIFSEESNQSICANHTENLVESKESRKRSLSEDEHEDDGRLCPICLDNWTNTGDHRICSLKCGHLFGYKCVNRWLESQSKKTCPTCKKKVGRGDLRYIYANKLIAVDTAELESMKKQLDLAMEEKHQMLYDMSTCVLRESMLKNEIAKLKKQLFDLGSNRAEYNSLSQSTSNSSSDNTIVRLYMEKSLDICRNSGCRVLDVNCNLDLIMTSMKSPNSLFAGYGIRKVNISQYKPLAFVPVHSLQIRDIAFHPINNWVLTASMDKTFKIVNCTTNATVTVTSQTMPLWSCCWDADNEYHLYIGTQTGAVIKYDMRQLSEPYSTLAVPGDMSPVVAIASLPSRPGGDLVRGGVISCKLNSLWVFENTGLDYMRHNISLEGPFVSMKYQPDTQQLLVSSRPNNRRAYSRHTVCTLEKTTEEAIKCNVVHSFQGGGMQKLLSKSCFLSDKHDLVAAHQETCKSVYLWSINSGQKVCSIPAHDAVLDLRGVQHQNGNYLISLTEKKLEFFKFY